MSAEMPGASQRRATSWVAAAFNPVVARSASAALALAVLMTGCGPARDSPQAGGDSPVSVASIAPSEVTTTIVGGSSAQQDELREILAGMGPTRFQSVEVVTPEPAWGPHPEDAVALVVPVGESDLLGQWQSWLLVHAFAARSRALGLPAVTHLAERRGGVDAEEGLGPVLPEGQSHPTLAEAERAAERARRAAERHGAEVVRIEILQPDGYAFYVELRVTKEPARFLRDGLPRVLGLVGGPVPFAGETPYAGDYSLILDGEGEQIWEGAEAKFGDGSFQIGGAARWDLEGCSPFFRGGPPGRGPPPCPADSAKDSDSRSDDLQVKTIPPSDVTTKIIGATPKQETILREILSGIGHTRVKTVEIAKASRNMPGPAHAVQLNIEVPPDDRVADWHMQLIAKAFREGSRELGLPPVVFYSGGRVGSALVDEPREPDLTLAQARDVAKRIREAAARHDAKVRRLELIRPRRFAFVLVLQVDDPAEFLLRRYEDVVEPLDDVGIRRYDGRSIEVIDGEGKFVMGSGGWFSVREELAGCAPGITSGSLGDPGPPPCPAE
jgi:hypothetical protein